MPVEKITALADALGFSDEDLEANRAGRLSEAQKARLTRGWRQTLSILIAVVIGFVIVATILLFVAQRNNSPILTVIGILVTMINATIVGLGAQSYLRTSSDIHGGRVTVISGVVSHTIRVSGRVATYILRLDGQEVVVSKSVFFAVEDGKAYRLYRAPTSKTLLAAEPT